VKPTRAVAPARRSHAGSGKIVAVEYTKPSPAKEILSQFRCLAKITFSPFDNRR